MNHYDCIIAGGSFAGLSAALSLGRALRKVLIIDSDTPCNKEVQATYNYLGQDGKSPRRLRDDAKEELTKYSTVQLLPQTVVTNITRNKSGFNVHVNTGEQFTCSKVLLATGLQDVLPDIPGFAECWGNTIIHCPFCHGYEMRDQLTAILANGTEAVEFTELLRFWTTNLYVFTNGKSTIRTSQLKKLNEAGISVEPTEIKEILHLDGKLQAIVLKDDRSFLVKALYYQPESRQQTNLAERLGCRIDKHGLVEVDVFQATNVKGVYAAGDACSSGRSAVQAVASGSVAGIFMTKALIHDDPHGIF